MQTKASPPIPALRLLLVVSLLAFGTLLLLDALSLAAALLCSLWRRCGSKRQRLQPGLADSAADIEAGGKAELSMATPKGQEAAPPAQQAAGGSSAAAEEALQRPDVPLKRGLSRRLVGLEARHPRCVPLGVWGWRCGMGMSGIGGRRPRPATQPGLACCGQRACLSAWLRTDRQHAFLPSLGPSRCTCAASPLQGLPLGGGGVHRRQHGAGGRLPGGGPWLCGRRHCAARQLVWRHFSCHHPGRAAGPPPAAAHLALLPAHDGRGCHGEPVRGRQRARMSHLSLGKRVVARMLLCLRRAACPMCMRQCHKRRAAGLTRSTPLPPCRLLCPQSARWGPACTWLVPSGPGRLGEGPIAFAALPCRAAPPADAACHVALPLVRRAARAGWTAGEPGWGLASLCSPCWRPQPCEMGGRAGVAWAPLQGSA